MPEEKSVLVRLRTRLPPQLVEDWRSTAGQKWRAGISKFSDYCSKHLRLGERLEAAPDLAWLAAQGAASIQYAQAEKAYAEAENIKIDAELRRRTMDSSVAKAQAEVEMANIAVLQARLDLYKKLKDAGVAVTLDSSINLHIVPMHATPPLELTEVFDADDVRQIEPKLVNIKFFNVGTFSVEYTPITKIEWLVSVGSRVESGTQIGIADLSTSPPSGHRILSKAAGIVTFLLDCREDAVISSATVLAKILPDQ